MISEHKLKQAMDEAIHKITSHMDEFQEGFPDAQSKDYVYPSVGNTGWTNSFYTGMLWLIYENTGNALYLEQIEKQLESFAHRIENRIDTDTHDLGFLYTLSCVAAYRIKGDEKAKQSAILAADALIERFKPKGNFIQAWGDINDPANYRLIIDCLLNLPLLYWAAEVTGDKKYYDIAYRHLKTAVSVLIRADASTYHTYYFDPETGSPTRGTTFQGYSDDSCWARGQAWGIYGLALSYAYTRDESLIADYKRIVDYFIAHLPEDNIPYWDLIFTSGTQQPRDTSAAAIAACGMLEMDRYIGEKRYAICAEKMIDSLIDNYTTKNLENSNGLLTDGMYNKNAGHTPECTIFGDYYYLEALTRLSRDWKMYW